MVVAAPEAVLQAAVFRQAVAVPVVVLPEEGYRRVAAVLHAAVSQAAACLPDYAEEA